MASNTAAKELILFAKNRMQKFLIQSCTSHHQSVNSQRRSASPLIWVAPLHQRILQVALLERVSRLCRLTLPLSHPARQPLHHRQRLPLVEKRLKKVEAS